MAAWRTSVWELLAHVAIVYEAICELIVSLFVHWVDFLSEFSAKRRHSSLNTVSATPLIPSALTCTQYSSEPSRVVRGHYLARGHHCRVHCCVRADTFQSQSLGHKKQLP
jgi:hypothetical protein